MVEKIQYVKVTFTLPKEVLPMLEELAKSEYRSKSSVVAYCIKKYYETKK